MTDRDLSVGEVALTLGVSERTVRQLISDGQLRAYRLRNRIRVAISSLDKMRIEQEIRPETRGA